MTSATEVHLRGERETGRGRKRGRERKRGRGKEKEEKKRRKEVRREEEEREGVVFISSHYHSFSRLESTV